MIHCQQRLLILLTSLMLIIPCQEGWAIPGKQAAKRTYLARRIAYKYPEQLTDPEKKERKTFSQFGYNLYEFSVPIFPITKFIKPTKFGYQSYGKPNRRMEKNGVVYTCNGGFIDFSHMRAAIDWTVFLTFKIISDTNHKEIDLPWEAGDLRLRFKNLNKLTTDDITNMAQKIAFERLVWHEIASWHYHKPYRFFSEQASTFTPEDNYSNMLGTTIGKRVAMRLLTDTTTLSYSKVATEEIQKMIASLHPFETKKESKRAYDIVDLNKQQKLPEDKRNKDVWYDSKIVFRDQRYIFKRNLNIGPDLGPWLVPLSEQVCCPMPSPFILKVPQTTNAGNSFYSYYEFRITPDTNMFYDHKKNRQLAPTIAPFSTNHIDEVMTQLKTEMAQVLLPGFDKRDRNDPTVFYTHLHKVFLK